MVPPRERPVSFPKIFLVTLMVWSPYKSRLSQVRGGGNSHNNKGGGYNNNNGGGNNNNSCGGNNNNNSNNNNSRGRGGGGGSSSRPHRSKGKRGGNKSNGKQGGRWKQQQQQTQHTMTVCEDPWGVGAQIPSPKYVGQCGTANQEFQLLRQQLLRQQSKNHSHPGRLHPPTTCNPMVKSWATVGVGLHFVSCPHFLRRPRPLRVTPATLTAVQKWIQGVPSTRGEGAGSDRLPPGEPVGLETSVVPHAHTRQCGNDDSQRQIQLCDNLGYNRRIQSSEIRAILRGRRLGFLFGDKVLAFRGLRRTCFKQ